MIEEIKKNIHIFQSPDDKSRLNIIMDKNNQDSASLVSEAKKH